MHQKIKCVVWDLDNTLWNGILSEGDALEINPQVATAIREFDARGILQSIASKNDYDLAWRQLQTVGLSAFFLYPQIHWESKAASVEQIAKNLNIGLDTFAFIDDQPFERDEVRFNLPEVRVYDPCNLETIMHSDAFAPRFITEDSAKRRLMYQSDLVRKQKEDQFNGSSDAFLATLKMDLMIHPARKSDLQRAEELTQRTHQLNTTGHTFSYEELDQFRIADDHVLLVSELNDKYGTYGKIGLTLIETSDNTWKIRLLLMSCRVMSRGVGGAMITFLRNEAKKAGVHLLAEFRETDRNRMMYITYKFAGFEEIDENGPQKLLQCNLESIPPYSTYLTLQATISEAS